MAHLCKRCGRSILFGLFCIPCKAAMAKAIKKGPKNRGPGRP